MTRIMGAFPPASKRSAGLGQARMRFGLALGPAIAQTHPKMIAISTRAELTLDAARAKLMPPVRRSSSLPALGAAALAALAALALAGAVILGPPDEGASP